jgi:hypothetical protein
MSDREQPEVARHALVPRDGFMVPLIGVPAEAALQECECCHLEYGLLDLEFNGVQMLCAKCRSSSEA